MYRRILVPTDGSEVATLAAKAAVEFARACGSEIVALSVAQPYPVPGGEASAMVDVGDMTEFLMAQARSDVQQVAELAAAAGVQCTTVVEYAYSPSAQILEAAKTHQCDLIFMGSHGRRGLSRLLAGSETQHVLAYSQVPVMVLRPQAQAASAQPASAGTHATGTDETGTAARS